MAVAAVPMHGQAFRDDDQIADAIGRQLEHGAALRTRVHAFDAGEGGDALRRVVDGARLVTYTVAYEPSAPWWTT